MDAPIPAWHFVSDTGLLSDGNPALEGETTVVEGGILEVCQWGLHASRKAIDALTYAPGSLACRVECWGENLIDVLGSDQLVARNRKIVWMRDAKRVLHEFAVWSAKQVTNLMGSRSLQALEIKQAWLDGLATNGELQTARQRAINHAWLRGWMAAVESHTKRNFHNAGRSAAKSAAWALTTSHAHACARVTARDAAKAYAWSICSSMETWHKAYNERRDAQNQELERRLNDLQ